MIILSVIFIFITFIFWKNTVVYRPKQKKNGYYFIDYSNETALDFTWLHIIGLALLLIPYFNVVWFAILFIWYLKRASEPERNIKKTDQFWEPKGIISFIIKVYNILNTKI